MKRSQAIKILWITNAWTVFSIFQFLVSYGYFVDLGFADEIDMTTPLKTSILTGILAGIMGGSGVVLVWEKWLRTRPYGWSIRNILITYAIIFVMVGLPSNLFYQSNLVNESMFSLEVWRVAVGRLLSYTTIIPFFTWLIVVMITIIALLVNDKYGPGVFRKFLLGKYFNPHREERIFMFLDLRSSTSIAEKLGEEKYFSFLKDVFKYATPSILKYGGEIYQYVGDEIVISWEMHKGTKDASCIQCYFSVQGDLNDRRQYFLDHYQVQPEFKAGVHQGYVMAGELGVVKREIAYSGDVLNTTARIQAKCNELGVNILASDSIIDRLQSNVLKPREIGEIELRGKSESVRLFTV